MAAQELGVATLNEVREFLGLPELVDIREFETTPREDRRELALELAIESGAETWDAISRAREFEAYLAGNAGLFPKHRRAVDALIAQIREIEAEGGEVEAVTLATRSGDIYIGAVA